MTVHCHYALILTRVFTTRRAFVDPPRGMLTMAVDCHSVTVTWPGAVALCPCLLVIVEPNPEGWQ